MNTCKALLLTLTGALGIVTSAFSETASETGVEVDFVAVQSLSPLVVTGTRTEKILMDSPVRVDVIDRAAIEAQQAITVSDALQHLPGVQLRDIHGREGQGVYLQGFTSDQVLVLIDGMPVTATAGSTVNVSAIGTANIERIEVVRGATSALYGTDAMGGVVNIITRQPERTALEVFWSGTSYGPRNTSNAVFGQLADQRVGWHGALRLGDWTLAQQAEANLATGSDRDLSTRKEDTYSGLDWSATNSMSKRIGDGQLRLSARLSGADRHRPETLNGAPYVFRDLSSQWTLAGDWQTQAGALLSRSQIQIDQLNQHTEQDAVNTSVLEQRRVADIRQQTLSQQWDWTIAEHLVTTGVDYRRQSLHQEQTKTTLAGIETTDTEVDAATQQMIALFVQDDVFLTDTVEFLPGARLQWDEGFGWFLAPKMNLRWDPNRLQTAHFSGHIRLGAGVGYRVPNLKERYYFFDHAQFGYRVEGNPALAPEQVVSWQLGMTLNAPSWSLNVGGFLNQAEDLIVSARDDAASTSAGLDVYQYQNVEQATLSGIDAELRLRLPDTPHSVTFTYHGLYAMNDTTNHRLPGRTPHVLGVQADISGPSGWQWHTALRHYSSTWSDADNTMKTPAWAQLDAAVTWQPQRTVQLFLRANNLLDAIQTVSNNPDFRPLLGRRFTAGTQLALF